MKHFLNKLQFLMPVVIAAGISCNPVEQVINPEKNYAYDLPLKVNGALYPGRGIVPFSTQYDVEVTFPRKTSFLRYSSCHRDHPLEITVTSNRYRFIPVPDIETKFCPLTVEAIYDNGKKQSAILFFHTDFYSAAGLLRCNGSNIRYDRQGFCQARTDTTQQIVTDYPSYIESSCPYSGGGRTFDIPVKSGFCVYTFQEKHSKKYSSVTVYGYDDIILKGF